MKSQDIRHDDGDHEGTVSVLLAPMLAVLLVGGGLALFEPVSGQAPARSPIQPVPAPEISASQYEALRDMIPADRSMAKKVSAALASGARIDSDEYEDLTGDAGMPAPTHLDVAAAREDLAMTLRAYSLPER